VTYVISLLGNAFSPPFAAALALLVTSLSTTRMQAVSTLLDTVSTFMHVSSLCASPGCGSASIAGMMHLSNFNCRRVTPRSSSVCPGYYWCLLCAVSVVSYLFLVFPSADWELKLEVTHYQHFQSQVGPEASRFSPYPSYKAVTRIGLTLVLAQVELRVGGDQWSSGDDNVFLLLLGGRWVSR